MPTLVGLAVAIAMYFGHIYTMLFKMLFIFLVRDRTEVRKLLPYGICNNVTT